MKSKLQLLVALILSTTFPVTGQTLLRGVVKNAETNIPIAQAKIGVVGQGVGEISDERGLFFYRKYAHTLDLDSKLHISASGYEDLELGIDDIRYIFDTTATIALTPSSQTKQSEPAKNITVFWDTSEGMVGRDTEKELDYLASYLKAKGTVTVNFVAFRDKPVFWKKEKIKDGDITRFRESVLKTDYSGPANYDILDTSDADEILLFSNGEYSFGTFDARQDVPVHTITSSGNRINEDYLAKLSAYTGGQRIDATLAAQNLFDKKTYKIENESTTPFKTVQKTISGQVTSLGKLLQGASIRVQGTLDEYATDFNGTFEIPASEGDVLLIDFLAMFQKEVTVQNSIPLKIELFPKNDELKEVILTSQRKTIITGNTKIKGTPSTVFPGGITSAGAFYITSDDIKEGGLRLQWIMMRYFKGFSVGIDEGFPALFLRGKLFNHFYVNGYLWRDPEPPYHISDDEIVSIIFKDSDFTTSRFGPRIGGPAILITTKDNPWFQDDIRPSALIKGNDYEEEVAILNPLQSKSVPSNWMKGIVTSLSEPVQGATIRIKGNLDEYKTEVDGSFALPAGVNDVLVIDALGMFTKETAVKDKSKMLEIALFPKNDVLDEVVITATTEKLVVNNRIAEGQKVKGAPGGVTGPGDFYITEKDITPNALTIENLMRQKFKGVQVSKRWDGKELLTIRGKSFDFYIDGVRWENPYAPPFHIADKDIASIIVKDDPKTWATRYGILKQGRMVIVTTKKNNELQNSLRTNGLAQNNEYVEDNVASINDATVIGARSSINRRFEISGTVRLNGAPVQAASIREAGTFNEYYTDASGQFTFLAKQGETYTVKALGTYAKTFEVTTDTQYSITLIPTQDTLDEILISGAQRIDNTIESSTGKQNADKLQYSDASEIRKENFNNGAVFLGQLIAGRFPGVQVALRPDGSSQYLIRTGSGSISGGTDPVWDVNGMIYTEEPTFLDVQQIESITILKSLAETNRYGSLGRSGVFVIKTINSGTDFKEVPKPKTALVEGNEYANDAQLFDAQEPDYITAMRKLNTPEEQYAYYQKRARRQQLSLEYYSDVVHFFQETNLAMANQVRADLAYIARNNTKALRTLAYLYEAAGDVQKTLLTYERILEIAPQEAQSYRDVANIYQETGRYNQALELYRNMLGERIKGVNFKGIEPVLRSELQRLVQLHKDKIEFDRLPNEWLRTGFKSDIRLVIEYSDRTAPFEFQFVNPERKFFKWNHTLEENRERLEEERTQGYQTEEFILDDTTAGEWLVNVQYFGEDTEVTLPPFLKYTLYRDYGTSKETKETRVIKLFKQKDKVTLGKIVI